MEKRIIFPLNARYFTYGNPQANNLLVALHGYGQLASYFIKKFDFLDPEQYFVIAPEGLHRFYLQGSEGRVGASWMTKEDRENDIDNYLRFIGAVMAENTVSNRFSKKILLGFSQGGATASRYLAHSGTKFDAFILWAAVFPPDMKKSSMTGFRHTKNYFVVGDQDQYYPESDVTSETDRLKNSGLTFELRKFAGQHTIDPVTLTDILHEI